MKKNSDAIWNNTQRLDSGLVVGNRMGQVPTNGIMLSNTGGCVGCGGQRNIETTASRASVPLILSSSTPTSFTVQSQPDRSDNFTLSGNFTPESNGIYQFSPGVWSSPSSCSYPLKGVTIYQALNNDPDPQICKEQATNGNWGYYLSTGNDYYVGLSISKKQDGQSGFVSNTTVTASYQGPRSSSITAVYWLYRTNTGSYYCSSTYSAAGVNYGCFI